MIVIACVDDRMGMLFNRRRQSQDKARQTFKAGQLFHKWFPFSEHNITYYNIFCADCKVLFTAPHRYKRPGILTEALIKSRLTAWHAFCLHLFRYIAQFVLARRQPCVVLIVQSDGKSAAQSAHQI